MSCSWLPIAGIHQEQQEALRPELGPEPLGVLILVHSCQSCPREHRGQRRMHAHNVKGDRAFRAGTALLEVFAFEYSGLVG